ncbi:cyclin-like protein [Mycotypha africana]|uniref:cyclin-like protein n=1 Tax=Mycotypha africana TaxID=64632 RepID=UPI002301B174|nr:cyclin-like protein [Mycotypha africana]KAI8984374.1 cyclin-like protein [Mycotypha africana]
MRCHNCGSSNTETDTSAGTCYCVDCGTVLEENTIVSEVTFGETSSGKAILQGSYAGESGRIAGGGLYGRRGGREGQEQAIENGRLKIANLAHALRLPERYRDSAQRYYNLAVVNRFTRGRKSDHVAAVCLYAVCRTEKSAQMLIDFSDLLQVNVFTLGATFLKLCRVLNLHLPHVDPSLYISRFAVALDFGDYTQRVAQDAVRIAQRMDRDWITSGRRPAGICGACLLIAARMNGFRRTVREMIYIVKVAEITIQKRLQEFGETDSANLKVHEFRTIWLEKRADPPSFKRNRLITEDAETEGASIKSEVDELDDQYRIENNTATEQDLSSVVDELNKGKGKTTEDEAQSLLLNPELELDAEEIAEEMETWLEDKSMKKAATEIENEAFNDSKAKDKTLDNKTQEGSEKETEKEEEGSADEEKEVESKEEEDISLSDVDDEEIEAMILDPEEVTLKTQIWYNENKDYLEEMAIRRSMQKEKGVDHRKGRSKVKKKLPPAATPAEAAKQLMGQKKISKKINQAIFDDMFESPEAIEKIKARDALSRMTGSSMIPNNGPYEVVEESGDISAITSKKKSSDDTDTKDTTLLDDDEDEDDEDMDPDDMAEDEVLMRKQRDLLYGMEEDYGEEYGSD